MFYLYPTAQNNKLKSHVLYTISPFCLSPNLNLPKKAQQIHIQNVYKPWNVMRKIAMKGMTDLVTINLFMHI